MHAPSPNYLKMRFLINWCIWMVLKVYSRANKYHWETDWISPDVLQQFSHFCFSRPWLTDFRPCDVTMMWPCDDRNKCANAYVCICQIYKQKDLSIEENLCPSYKAIYTKCEMWIKVKESNIYRLITVYYTCY